MTEALPTLKSTALQTASLRERSTSAIQAAIHSPSDKGLILRRANAVMALYFDPDFDAETRLNSRAEFVTALEAYPSWAVERAFDAWVRQHARRPSPAEIGILAKREVDQLKSEIDRRKPPNTKPDTPRMTAGEAAQVMADSGVVPNRMVPRMCAPGGGAIEIEPVQPKHWTDGLPYDHPRIKQLREDRKRYGCGQRSVEQAQDHEQEAGE